MTKKTICITGGAGYIGSKLVDSFLSKGDRVVVIDDLSHGTKRNVHPKAVLYQESILSKNIYAILKRENPEIIFHLAALKDVEASMSHPKEFIKVNVDGSLNVLSVAKDLGIKKFVFTSTAAVYGDTFTSIYQTEDQTPNPISAYGQTKLEVEKMVGHYNKTYNMQGIVLRFANVYGPGGQTQQESVIHTFTKNILQKKTNSLYGDGSQTRDFVNIDDIVHFCVFLFQKEYIKHTRDKFIFNIATGRAISVQQALQIVETLSNIQARIRYQPNTFYGQKGSVLSPELTQKTFGWSCQTSLESGVRNLIEYYTHE